MKRVLVLAAMAILCGCASEPPPPPSLQEILASLVGKPAREASAIFGNPSTIHPSSSGALYTWTAKQSAPANPGLQSSLNAKGAELAAALRSNPNAVQPPVTCTLTMTMTAAGRIRAYKLSGDASRCGSFIRAAAPTKP
jgi:hypothetical protein